MAGRPRRGRAERVETRQALSTPRRVPPLNGSSASLRDADEVVRARSQPLAKPAHGTTSDTAQKHKAANAVIYRW